MDRIERIRKRVREKMNKKKKILLIIGLFGLILLSGCANKKMTSAEKCIDICSRIELNQPPQGDYFVRGIWDDNTQTCTCKTFVESEPTFNVDLNPEYIRMAKKRINKIPERLDRILR